MQVFRGVALLTTDGQSVLAPTSTREMPDPFSWWPAAIAVYALNYRAVGRAVYAVGGNCEGSPRVRNLSIGRTKVYVYAISGVLAAIGGILLVARLSAANALLAEGEELRSIASVVIGGTNSSSEAKAV